MYVAGSRIPFHSLGKFFFSATELRHHTVVSQALDSRRQNLFAFGESASAIIKTEFPHLSDGNTLSQTPSQPASQLLLLVAKTPGHCTLHWIERSTQ